MKIINSQLQHFFNTKNWNIALRFFKQNVVDEIIINEAIPGLLYNIDAVVPVYGYENHCHIKLNADGYIIAFSCECPYCIKNETACAHIGVVLLIVLDLQPNAFPFLYKPTQPKEDVFRRYLEKKMLERSHSFVERYIQKDMAAFHAHTLLEKVHLQAQCTYTDAFLLNYRIGIQRDYVLRNLLAFLEAIERQEEVEYGKQLKFLHHMQAFDEAAQAQIVFLKKYIREHEQQYSFGYGGSRKQIVIDELAMDSFYELYSKDAADCIDIRFAEEDCEEIVLHIEMQDDFFVITTPLSLEQLWQGEQYWYYMNHLTLQRFSRSFSEHMQEMLEQLKQDRQVLIHKDDMIRFCTYVIPAIRDYVQFEGISLDTFMPYPIEIECYIDIEDSGDISIRLLYHYEDSPAQYAFSLHADSSLELDHVKSYIETYATTIDHDTHIAYIAEDSPHFQTFLSQGVEYLNQLCSVYVSDALQQLQTPKSAHISVGIRMKNRLLELDVQSVNIPKEELYHVMRAYRRKKKFHRLKNGDLLYLQSQELQEADELLQQLHIPTQQLEMDNIPIDTFHAFQLHSFAQESKHTQITQDESFTSMIEQLTHIKADSFPLDPHYDAILRDYQKFGYQWLKTMCAYGLGGILADDMGLGKTLQAIALLEDFHRNHNVSTSIIVCPASLIYNWQDEIRTFSLDLRACCIQGTNTKRLQAIHKLNDFDVVITSYDYLRKDYESYKAHHFTIILLDEAQYIKNHTTKNAAAVKQLKGEHRFALTGTPIENSLSELWSIFDFLMPGYLYSYHRFREQLERKIIKDNDANAQKQLKHMVEPFILRRVKKDVLEDLPDKLEQVFFQEFNEEEKNIYYANLVSINKDLQKHMQMEDVDKFQVLAMMTRLRQICCDLRLLYENVTQPSTKLKGCMDLIVSAKKAGRHVLLFSSFTSMLALLEEQLRMEDIRYLKLTGETKKELRHAYVKQFQNGEADVFLISLKAGGTGLNLTNAEIVIHYDPWWNISAQNQATDRAYRIGQTKDVQVYKLIMKDSIEEKIMQLQTRKNVLSDTFINNNETSITNMSKEEIMELFTMDPFEEVAS